MNSKSYLHIWRIIYNYEVLTKLSTIASTKLCLNTNASEMMSVRCSDENRMWSTFFPFRIVMINSFGTCKKIHANNLDKQAAISYTNAKKTDIRPVLYIDNQQQNYVSWWWMSWERLRVPPWDGLASWSKWRVRYRTEVNDDIWKWGGGKEEAR